MQTHPTGLLYFRITPFWVHFSKAQILTLEIDEFMDLLNCKSAPIQNDIFEMVSVGKFVLDISMLRIWKNLSLLRVWFFLVFLVGIWGGPFFPFSGERGQLIFEQPKIPLVNSPYWKTFNSSSTVQVLWSLYKQWFEIIVRPTNSFWIWQCMFW